MKPEWKKYRLGQFPEEMVSAGVDKDGSPIFVGRAFYEDDLLPAKVIPNRNVVSVCFDGGEMHVESFEMLRPGNYVWKAAAEGYVPCEAIAVGHTAYGEILFMGRAQYDGSVTPGKVHVTHCCLYIPFGGREIKIQEYEVLCAA